MRRFPGLIHGFANMTGVSRSANEAVLEIAGMLRMLVARPAAATLQRRPQLVERRRPRLVLQVREPEAVLLHLAIGGADEDVGVLHLLLDVRRVVQAAESHLPVSLSPAFAHCALQPALQASRPAFSLA